MMRFDLTCNISIALRAEPGRGVHVHALPALTEQQRLLHEVIWVEGCHHWTVSAQPDGARVLDLVGCESEVRVAFAASLTVAPVWCHAAALWKRAQPGITLPSACSKPNEHWSMDRIVAALRPALRDTAAVFAALPELFQWLRQFIDVNKLRHYARAPMERASSAQDGVLASLEFAVAVFEALGVPARIVAGFAPESDGLNAHDARAFNLELHRGGRWWLFEPDGQVPAFGFIRTAVGCEPSDFALVRGAASAQPLRMDASVDPPPAWGLPLRTSSRLLLSLDAQDTRGQTPAAGTTLSTASASTPV
jgi:hypothetical protein